MTSSPKGMRCHIGLFGRRNVGKSSLLNAIAGQAISLVSPVAGTTTDLVEKPMELLPLGPVLWIDTAGLDDEGGLGGLRIERTRQAMNRVDMAVLVAEAGNWSDFEQGLWNELAARKLPTVVVLNKIDLHPDVSDPADPVEAKVPIVRVSTVSGVGLDDFRQAILAAAPQEFIESPPLAHDLVPPGGLAVLVVPIDKEAPKGRLILPQAQVIRDLLDADRHCLTTRETSLARALDSLRKAPDLVITDSQAFREVAAVVPDNVPLTGFSILFARARGDLESFAAGAAAIDGLRPGDEILMAESCTHHALDDDIGRVKIPALLRKKAGGELHFRHARGVDFPLADGGKPRLVVHCGACMTNRREVLSRIARCNAAGIPVANYGMTIAHCLGLLERALAPFPRALAAYLAAKKS